MDILLSHGYTLLEDEAERAIMKPYPPLGLLYLSAHLKKAGLAVGVFDPTFAGADDFGRFIAREKPPVVGLYTNMMTRTNVLRQISICREAGCYVILGGPEPVNYAERYLAHGADIIVAGEGEQTLVDLLAADRENEAALSAIPGIVFQGRDGIVRTEARGQIKKLDDQPFPDRAAIDIGRYLATWKTHHGASSLSMITARGCPYTCRWCSHSVFGHSYRHRSPENVADELATVIGDYHPERIWYADDVFTMNAKWLRRFADTISERGLIRPFEAISREDRLNEDVIRTLRDMQCARLWVGAESGSQRVLDAMDRRTNAARMREMIIMLRDYGIETGTFIMLGYDRETTADIAETRRHLLRALPDTVLSTIAYPIKGTPFYDDVETRLVRKGRWEDNPDRLLGIGGRRSRRYYRHAEAWIGRSVSLARRLRRGRLFSLMNLRDLWRLTRARLGMALAAGETGDG